MAEIKDNRQWMRSMLRQETADWTPQCPDPETLLDWLNLGDRHPEAKQLLAHLFSCAHCRQQRVALREILALSAESQREATSRIDPGILQDLPMKVRKWVRELVADGRTAIRARSVSAALDLLAVASVRSLESSALTRSLEKPVDLRPANTAVRSGRPTLHWSAVAPAKEYEIDILRPVGRKGLLESVWNGPAGSEQQLTLPEEAELRPGSYLWQVIALTDDGKVFSDMAGFVVLKESIRQEIELLEHNMENSRLARIGLYEAYGLYEEALQQAEALIQLHAEDETVHRIHSQLAQRTSS